MPSYRQADPEDVDLLAGVMREYHPELASHRVEVGLLYAHASRDKETGEPKGPALRLHGHPCLATVKINALKDRVEGKPDATVCLDGDVWGTHSPERKRAILDHELTHLLIDKDAEGQAKLDDCNRPKLEMRMHDLVCGGFTDVVRRHKESAVESDHYKDIARVFSQLCFPWG